MIRGGGFTFLLFYGQKLKIEHIKGCFVSILAEMFGIFSNYFIMEVSR